MKGLMSKEFASLDTYKKTFLVMIVLVIGVSIFTNMGGSYVPMMLMMTLLISSMSLYTADESSNWNRFAVTLPVSRFQIVAARYLFLLVCLACMFAFNILLSFVLSLVKPQGPWLFPALATNGMMAACFLFVNALTAPLSYKFGVEKSRIMMLGIFILPFLGTVFSIPYVLPFVENLTQLQTGLLAGGGVVALLGLYCLSALISTRIYTNKEF